MSRPQGAISARDLGNTHVALAGLLETVQLSNHFPFGLLHPSSNTEYPL